MIDDMAETRARPGEADPGTQLRKQLRAVRQHWWIVALCVISAAAAAYAYGTSRPKQYESTARLLIQGGDLGTTLVGLNDFQQTDPEREAATALALAEQPVVATRVIQSLDLDLTPAELDAKVTASAEGNSRLIAISATDRDPREATRLANAYATEYIGFRRDTARAEVREALRGVQQEIEAANALNQDTRVEDLETRRDQLETLAGLKTGGAQLIQPAIGLGTLVSTSPVRIAILGGVLGLLLGLGLAYLRDRLDPRLKREEEINEILPGVPVIAAIPSWRRDPAQALQSEGFRALQTTLSFLDPNQELSSILVTSATVGEGKTTTTLNLALAIAERDESVLVLEGDLRRRGLSERLGLTDLPGVSEILHGEGSVEDFVVPASLLDQPDRRLRRDGRRGLATPTLTGTVNVVPAGRIAENPHRLLTSERVRRLLAEATEAADKVVVDGTPLGLLNDMLPVAGRVDATVVVVHLYHTRRNELKRLAAQLSHARIEPFGLVIFGVDTDRAYDAYIRR
jgi:succinoglycan biosynthesis transport protein ExoP